MQASVSGASMGAPAYASFLTDATRSRLNPGEWIRSWKSVGMR